MMGRNSSIDDLADINENNIYSLSRSQVNKLFLAAVVKFPDFFSFHDLPNSLQESTFESRIDCLILILDNAVRLRNLWLDNNISFLEFMADCIYWLWDQELSFDNFLCLNCVSYHQCQRIISAIFFNFLVSFIISMLYMFSGLCLS